MASSYRYATGPQRRILIIFHSRSLGHMQFGIPPQYRDGFRRVTRSSSKQLTVDSVMFTQSELGRQLPALGAIEEQDGLIGASDDEKFSFKGQEMDDFLSLDLPLDEVREIQRLLQEMEKGEDQVIDGIIDFDRGGSIAGDPTSEYTSEETGESRIEDDKKVDESTSRAEQSRLPFANCTDVIMMARHLQKTYVAFSSLDERSIVKLLQKGAKDGVQPKLSNDNQGAQVPLKKLSKRRGRKRGPYKLSRKDSWTSCSERGGSGSGSALSNASQNLRNPLPCFKERSLTVNDIELHQESMGVAEIPPFDEYERDVSEECAQESQAKRSRKEEWRGEGQRPPCPSAKLGLPATMLDFEDKTAITAHADAGSGRTSPDRIVAV